MSRENDAVVLKRGKRGAKNRLDRIPKGEMTVIFLRRVPSELKRVFKACCTERDESITSAILRFMRVYIDEVRGEGKLNLHKLKSTKRRKSRKQAEIDDVKEKGREEIRREMRDKKKGRNDE